MRILVTGGCGFVGSHIVDALVDGNEVDVIDRLDWGAQWANEHAYLIAQQLQTIPQQNVDLVVHCAAHADVSRNWDSMLERSKCWSDNVDATMHLLERLPQRTHVIFLSTCAVYGDTPLGTEEEACTATSPYAASKLAGEALVQAYGHARKSRWHVLRLGCVVGNRYHHGHVADFVRMAKLGQLRPRNNGQSTKSFVHVADVVDAVQTCIRQDVPNGVYSCIGEPWSPRDTVRVMGAEAIWPDNTHGWIGDPMAIASQTKLAPWFIPERRIEAGVRDALKSLGWPS